MTPPERRLRLALMWLAGIDLRVTLLALPPLIPAIHRDLPLDETGVAALSGLPVLLLGLAAIPGAALIARIGARRALLLGLLLIGVSSAFRGLGPSLPMLFAMTLCMGVGISVSQPTFPSLVRHWFPDQIAKATSFWSNGLLIGEVLAGSLTLPLVLPLVDGSWETSFVVWSVPVLITALLVLFLTPSVAAQAGTPGGRWLPDWRDARMWQLGVLQTSAGLTYFGANTFIPDYLTESGRGSLVGVALAVLNLAQIPASLAIGFLPWRLVSHRASLMAVALATFLGVGAAVLLGAAGALIGALLFGFSSAFMLVMCLALPPLLADRSDVARLSAGTFTIGYSLSFFGTLAAGRMWDATHVPATALLPILVAGCLVILLGPRVTRQARLVDADRGELAEGGAQ